MPEGDFLLCVKLGIRTPNFFRRSCIVSQVGVENGAELTTTGFAERLRHHERLWHKREVFHPPQALRNILGVIPDSLEISRDPDGADEKPKIIGLWLPPRNCDDSFFFDRALEFINTIIPGNYFARVLC